MDYSEALLRLRAWALGKGWNAGRGEQVNVH